jgi:sensor histidine kinase YesM
VQLEGGAIRITARRVHEVLTMSVQNNGPKLERVLEGVGIANTRARLKSLYGERANFEIRNNNFGQVEAILSVPYHSSR